MNWIKELLGPVVDLISGNPEAKAKLIEAETLLVAKHLELESQLINARRDVIVAEAQSESWITRSWRPMIMLTFGLLMALGSADFIVHFENFADVPDRMWTLMTTGIGGYIAARTYEKTQ